MARNELTPDEVALLKDLLTRYLTMPCVYCGDAPKEDRHIVVCTGCGSVIGDFKWIIENGIRKWEAA